MHSQTRDKQSMMQEEITNKLLFITRIEQTSQSSVLTTSYKEKHKKNERFQRKRLKIDKHVFIPYTGKPNYFSLSSSFIGSSDSPLETDCLSSEDSSLSTL